MLIDNDKMWMTRGDDEAIEIAITTTDGQPYAIQPGDVLTFTVRSAPSQDSPVLLQVQSVPGDNRIIIRHEDTAELDYGAYSADIQLTTAAGLRKTVWPPESASASRLRAGNLKNFNLMSEVTAL